jgi:hypothetical protein
MHAQLIQQSTLPRGRRKKTRSGIASPRCTVISREREPPASFNYKRYAVSTTLPTPTRTQAGAVARTRVSTRGNEETRPSIAFIQASSRAFTIHLSATSLPLPLAGHLERLTRLIHRSNAGLPLRCPPSEPRKQHRALAATSTRLTSIGATTASAGDRQSAQKRTVFGPWHSDRRAVGAAARAGSCVVE